MKTLQLVILLLLSITIHLHAQQNYYVATNGSDSNGNGSTNSPWATITHALDNATDGSTIWVKAGTYNGRIRIRGSFPIGILVKSELPYQAKLRHNSTVMTAYSHSSGCHGMTFDGFDIAHSGANSAPLVIHIDGNGNGAVHDIVYQNCIIHDSYNNDLAKINNSCYNITLQGNLFFNQTGSDEHIDGNSVENLIIQDNIFLNDFASSNRNNNNTTSSYIVIKDSNGNSDLYTGSHNITIRRNVFLNYEGSSGTNFVLVGEDGNSFYEGYDVMIENNLMLGNSNNYMRAPFGVKGGKNIIFRNNTVTGNMPSNAFAFRLNTEGDNPNNDSIYIYNNIWSDPTGTMTDFSDCPLTETDYFVLDNNIYWNNNASIPSSLNDLINYTDDLNRLQNDPLLSDPSNLVVPHYNATNNQFNDGSTTIREAFESLVHNYGTPASNSPVINAANSNQAPSEDILGHARTNPDIGAVEYDPFSSISSIKSHSLLNIFPNPSLGGFYFSYESSATGELAITVYTIDGRMIKSETQLKSTQKITGYWEASSIPAGLYLLEIQNSKGEKSSKTVVIN
ncbi:T9SS type A sorting domain-containing protein [Aureispira anguillae]|uniref:T9SS type A sorting domain-containing protein n=1 Tax=Aureispira anguillae TaxID=2864201 RepID=A0A915YBI8_9BACT|nr:T9SS type A sorting domain-containing protein [Aureispira anguillae]BDS10043.1 T9SS type A sorting domain-containing protein [Aureispira anguillae]